MPTFMPKLFANWLVHIILSLLLARQIQRGKLSKSALFFVIASNGNRGNQRETNLFLESHFVHGLFFLLL